MFISFAILVTLATPDGAVRFDPLAITAATVNGHRYMIYEIVGGTLVLTFQQPQASDDAIRLAVAGTYTDPHGNVDGCAVIDGTPHNRDACKPWRGLLLHTRHGFRMVSVEDSDPISKTIFRVPYLQTTLDDTVQTHVLVDRHAAQSFAPQQKIQRRAFAQLIRSGLSDAIVESTKRIDLTTFANDLAALNAAFAANLDMGTLGLGWVRDPATNAVRHIGTLDGKQVGKSNWIVLRSTP